MVEAIARVSSYLEERPVGEGMMGKIAIVSRNSTTFTRTGELDEEALRELLQGIVDAEIAVYLGSGGSGEANALTIDELRRVYEIGVEVYRGRLPVYAN